MPPACQDSDSDDLRHTAITELAEMGVADHVLESISGHLSRRMLEHYSHIPHRREAAGAGRPRCRPALDNA
jgi:integrase